MRRKLLRISLSALAVVVIGFVGCVYFLNNIFSVRKMCGSEGSYQLIAPDGQYRATLFEFDCGATTDFGTHIAVQSSSRKFDPFDVRDSELVLAADSDHNKAGIDINGMLHLRARWIDTRHLSIELPSNARVFRQQTQSGPVTISFQRNADLF